MMSSLLNKNITLSFRAERRRARKVSNPHNVSGDCFVAHYRSLLAMTNISQGGTH